MRKTTFKFICSFLVIIFAFGAVCFGASAESHSHLFTDGKCECGTYYLETGKTIRIELAEKGFRIGGVSWSTTENAPFVVDKSDSEGIIDTTYYAIVKGTKAGEGTLLAYSNGVLAQNVNIYVECKNHQFGEYVSDNNATCVDGTKTAKCNFCNITDTVRDSGSAVHNIASFTKNNDATCQKEGTKTGKCADCGVVMTLRDADSKLPHDFQNYVSDGNATCTAGGTKTGVCTMCSARNTIADSENGIGHDFQNYVSDGNATCEEDGTKTGKCVRCGATDTVTDSLSRLGHDYAQWVTEKEMTCAEDGLKTSTCSRCQNVKSEVIKMSGHHYIWHQEIEATCYSEGRTSGMSCSNCNVTFIECKPVPKTDHEKNVSIDPASMDDSGCYMVTCRFCDEIFKDVILYRIKTVKLEKTSYTYNGKTINPTVIVKDAKKNDLKKGTDYTVSYDSSSKNPGEYKVKIKFKGNYEGTKTLKYTIVPGKTSKIEATQTTNSITLKWNKVTKATGYKVYLYNKSTGKFEGVKTLTSNTYTIKSLKAGTTYKYAVKAYTKVGDTTFWADTYTTITTATKPATLNVTVTAGSKKATLQWNKVTGATGYQVYMQAPGGSFEKVKTTTDNKFTMTGLKKGVTYKFRVRAYKKVDGVNIYGDYKTYSVTVK